MSVRKRKEIQEVSRRELIAGCIEHTLLKPPLLNEQIDRLCAEAVEYGFRGVCVSPDFVTQAVSALTEAGPRVITVCGFPLGCSSLRAKAEEARQSMEEGAQEIDMVMNLSALPRGEQSLIREEVEAVSEVVRKGQGALKLIVECGYWNQRQLDSICEICASLPLDFVKTGTGFNAGGARVEDVEYLRAHLPKRIRIKAAGGIRNREVAQSMILAGADTIGTSASLQILA